MSDTTITCPHCGFSAHKLCWDGEHWKYVCERCGAIFIVG